MIRASALSHMHMCACACVCVPVLKSMAAAARLTTAYHGLLCAALRADKCQRASVCCSTKANWNVWRSAQGSRLSNDAALQECACV